MLQIRKEVIKSNSTKNSKSKQDKLTLSHLDFFTSNKIYVKSPIISLFTLLFISLDTANVKAQLAEGYRSKLELQSTATTSGKIPFWMRSNQFGSIPLKGFSLSAIGGIYKDYESTSYIDSVYGNKKLIDWAAGFEARANGGNGSNIYLIDAYAKVKLAVFQFKVGRDRDLMGLNGNTATSSGNFVFSGNALGIPELELSIPKYTAIPFLDNILSIKGNFSHGFMGKVKILDSIKVAPLRSNFYTLNNNPVTYLHQKSLYGRFGKPDWRLKLYGGFNHQAQWGNEKDAYGENFDLSPFQTFLYVATGKTYSGKDIPKSKIGNQIGSIDIGVEYDFDNFNVMIYRQSFYDVGALSKLANIKDGLNGINIKNKNYDSDMGGFQWNNVTFELFFSKDQAGYPWSTPTKSGDEDYYNNYYYTEGWSYKGLGLGNPLITQKKDAKNGQASHRSDNYINNRVVALHLGFQGQTEIWDFTTKATYSWNYGTFGTSKWGHTTNASTNTGTIQTTNLFEPVQQFSFYLDAMRNLNEIYRIGFSTGFDYGNLLNKSFGLQLKLSTNFE